MDKLIGTLNSPQIIEAMYTGHDERLTNGEVYTIKMMKRDIGEPIMVRLVCTSNGFFAYNSIADFKNNWVIAEAEGRL